ncbi:MAG TPA: ATP-binding cassette domain-containing protein, partial [Acidimicrobiia bacterium]|nr:ATP-binding cassette domain-containing protein [Acidimicrobiia bacterium]
IGAGRRGAGGPRRAKPEMAERLLTRVGLWDEVKGRLGDPAGALSAGQQQRLCLARSLAVGPRVLLMDEPCSTVDPSSAEIIEQTIREISRSVTVVIATTDVRQAARVSDYTAYFQADKGWPGRLVEFGPTGDLLNAPRDPRTEDYLQGR